MAEPGIIGLVAGIGEASETEVVDPLSMGDIDVEKVCSLSHEDAGFLGGCPAFQAEVRMSLRDHYLRSIGVDPDERDGIFRPG